ncbi:MAG: Gfo/Idh/MocA family oxidoreductase [Bacteroidota bacterium]|nr:Gfo/Idh/MocA family oxidoreductase [Bacteroidota bacterium]MDP4195372.1 Gfo/Idh/MocA family oxidoreductase [Bacteroidota bacterium]
MKKVINTAIAGFGYSARTFHAPFLIANNKFRLTKVLERHSKHSQELYPWVKIVKTIDELEDDSELDLVIITTPNLLHFEMAERLISAGKNVIVEKPFTLTYSEAQSLIEKAEKKNLVLSVFHNRRWDGDYMTVKKILENKLLGDLVEFESRFDRFRNYFKKNSWREEDQPGAGLLYDIGPHLIDQALNLFGAPKSLIADVRIQREGGLADDSFEIIFDYGKLKVTLKAGMLIKGNPPRFVLNGTKGSFVKYGLDPQEDTLKKGLSPLSEDYGRESEENWGILNTDLSGLAFKGKIETIKGNYMDYFNNVYNAISDSSKLFVKPIEAAETIKMIELAQESAAKGRRVLLN